MSSAALLLDERPATRSGLSPAAIAAGLRRQVIARAAAREDGGQRRLDTLRASTLELGRLARLDSAAALLDAAPEALCRAGGFSRAMLSRVDGSSSVPEVFHPRNGRLVAGFPAHQGRRLPLGRHGLETEATRRRVTLLTAAAGQDRRVSSPFLRAACSEAYVVAPILSGGRVIGFFHADRLGEPDPAVDEADRDAVRRFAEEFGLLFERFTLIARLQRSTAQLQQQLTRIASVVDGLCTADLDDEPQAARPATAGAGAAAGSAQRPRAALLLTARELEVLEHVASGATNGQIAERLTISVGTVKSHVKRIHTKLRVGNRAEAAAWYLRGIRG